MTKEQKEQLSKRYPYDYWDGNGLKVSVITKEDFDESVNFCRKCQLLGMSKSDIADAWVSLRKTQGISDMWSYKCMTSAEDIVAMPKAWMSAPDLRDNLDKLQVPCFVDVIYSSFGGVKAPKEINLSIWNDRLMDLSGIFQNGYSETLRLKLVSNRLKSINMFLYSGAVYKNVDLSKVNAPNVTDLSNLMSNCNNLTQLRLPNHLGDIKSIYKIVSGCRSLEYLDLSMLHGTLDVAESAFDGCAKLKYVDMRNLIFTESTSVKLMFVNTLIKEVLINKESYPALCKAVPSNRLHVVQD